MCMDNRPVIKQRPEPPIAFANLAHMTLARDRDIVSRAFAEERIRGVVQERDALDVRIEPRLKNWSLYRLGTVERNVLRLGVWELENCPEIPQPIVINEYVDLAKFFSETKSGRFVNGVLDRYAKSLREQKPSETETFAP